MCEVYECGTVLTSSRTFDAYIVVGRFFAFTNRDFDKECYNNQRATYAPENRCGD